MRTRFEKKLADALTEWERRYREDPERFLSEGEKLLKLRPRTYGNMAAAHLISIMAEQAK